MVKDVWIICSVCGFKKSSDNFYGTNIVSTKTGCRIFRKQCKLCISERAKVHYLKNRVDIRAKRKIKYHNDDNFRKKHLNYKRNLGKERTKFSIDVEQLRPPYLKRRLRNQGIKNPTPELIELKKLQLKLHRSIYG